MLKRKNTFKHHLEYTCFIAFVFLVRITPAFFLKWNKSLLRFLFGLISTRFPGIVKRNLELAFPEKSATELAELRKDIYRHFSSILVDIICLFIKKNPEKLMPPIHVLHWEYLEQAIEKKQGVLLFSAHFGNWELIPYILSRRLGKPVSSIARKMDNPLVEKKVMQFREFMGSQVIDKNVAARTMLKRLTENGIVYLLVDQNTIDREAVLVNYFGKPVSAVPSVSRLLLKKNIPVLPLFLHYESERIVLEFQPPLAPDVICDPTATNEERIQQVTQYCTTMIEQQVRLYPEQWLWFHNRWKANSKTSSDNISPLVSTPIFSAPQTRKE